VSLRLAAAVLVAATVFGTAAEFPWSLTVSTGSAYNFPTRLVIRQGRLEPIELTANWETRPFAEVPYYDIRLARGPWELELIHHKLYLANLPSGVTLFEITHGYNYIVGNRTFRLFGLGVRVGAGFILAHPESEVHGRRFDETNGILGTGWYVAGPAGQVGLAERLPFWQRWFLDLETKFTGAWARVPIADGSADVPNVALHGLVGVGFRF
jgi:hypothetical protein